MSMYHPGHGNREADENADRIRSGPLALEDRNIESSGASSEALSVYNNPYCSLNIRQQRARLPITKVPQYLLEAGWAKDGRIIGITQPRRVAVVTFMTDGILLRELLNDPLLSKYSVIMVDEAHERSCNTDILLGLLRKILAIRNDLRIIVSSATLDAELFRDFFELNTTNDPSRDTSCVISVEGRTHPVTIFHTRTSVLRCSFDIWDSSYNVKTDEIVSCHNFIQKYHINILGLYSKKNICSLLSSNIFTSMIEF
uniref:Helicase ATP-binding domain-containing protein n=1 Tax=Heterorhabditis bacteriophora TaxID=37862 RepID=A0A1I7XJC0_HETBA